MVREFDIGRGKVRRNCGLPMVCYMARIDIAILLDNLDCYDIVNNQPQTIYHVPCDLDWQPTVRARRLAGRAVICISDLLQNDTR